jgi:polysaccharide biosynthesis/export protein
MSVRIQTAGRRSLAIVRRLLGAALLCIGIAAVAPRTVAQGEAKPAQKVDPQVNVPIVAEDAIDPKQPLKPSFLINVSVAGEPEPSGNYVVDPAGSILLHVAEVLTPVAIGGQEPGQAASTIAAFLKKYINNPQVTVSILSVPRSIVTIGGAVKVPGTVIISSTTNLVDILSKAEWLENADLSQVRIGRRETVKGVDKRVEITLDVGSYIRPDPAKTLNESQNPVLHDKDTIFVPYKLLTGKGTVTVAGEVQKPQAGMLLRLDPPLTLREAVNLAGGLTPNANRKAISVRRANGGAPLVINFDKAEQNDPTQNIELKPDDAIYVEKLDPYAFVYVAGGVFKGGKVIYEKPMTLTQAVLEAGGLLPGAKEKEGKIIRRSDKDPKKTQMIAFNWKEVVSGKTEDIVLQPGDGVWIPSSVQAGPPKDFLSILSSLTPLGMLLGR